MFRRKEKQGLINARSYSLKQAEQRIEELTFLKKYYKQMSEEQRETITRQENLINDIIRELYSNVKTDTKKVEKLRELVRDWQSIN